MFLISQLQVCFVWRYLCAFFTRYCKESCITCMVPSVVYTAALCTINRNVRLPSKSKLIMKSIFHISRMRARNQNRAQMPASASFQTESVCKPTRMSSAQRLQSVNLRLPERLDTRISPSPKKSENKSMTFGRNLKWTMTLNTTMMPTSREKSNYLSTEDKRVVATA